MWLEDPRMKGRFIKLKVKNNSQNIMRFTVPGKLFQQQLQAMSRVLNSKNTLKILENFLFKIEDNKLWITGSDSENVMVSWIEVFDVEGQGEVAVSSKTVLDMVKEIGNQPITFNMDDETFQIKVNYLNGEFEFMGLNGNEYPLRNEPEAAETKEFTLSSEVITKGIEHTLFAVSQDNIRPIMTGIFWDIDVDNITFVSSDTHKLSRYINRQAQPGFQGGFILPSKPASILRSVLDKEPTDVHIKMNATGATFSFDQYSLSCKFIKGNYPNYKRVIPENHPFKMSINREALLTALRRVSLFASKSTGLVKIDVRPTQLILIARDFDYSTLAQEKVDCTYEGTSMTIGFSEKYMIEILNNLNMEEIQISLSDPARPGIFEPLTQEADENILVLQMPMQVIEQ